MNPNISVIVPNYNHAPYLQQRIDSILRQTYQDFELILLDDCSTDNSREILLSYKDHPHVTHVVFNEQNGGSPFAQWNKGIELAKGEWIWIAESDDWAGLDFLEIMMREVEKYDSVGLAYAKARYMYEGKEMWDLKCTGKTNFYTGEEFIRTKLIHACVIYNVSMVLFRRKLYTQIDHMLYNKMRLCGDWWFYTLLCQHTDVLEVDWPLTYYRVHQTNTSKSAEHMGLSFVEGLNILDYIIGAYSIRPWEYARFWGRQWVKYRKKFDFPPEVNDTIKKRVKKSHPLMWIFYVIYRIKKR